MEYEAIYESKPEGRTEGLLEVGTVVAKGRRELIAKLREVHAKSPINFGFVRQGFALLYYFSAAEMEKPLIIRIDDDRPYVKEFSWLLHRRLNLSHVYEVRRETTWKHLWKNPFFCERVRVFFGKRVFVFGSMNSAELILSSLIERDELVNTELLVALSQGLFRALVEYNSSNSYNSVFQDRLFVPLTEIKPYSGSSEKFEYSLFKRVEGGEL